MCIFHESQKYPPEKLESNLPSRFPKAVGWVNDFSKVFSDTEYANLNEKLARYEQQSGNPIVVVSIDVDTLKSEHFFNYSIALGNHWGVGDAKKNKSG